MSMEVYYAIKSTRDDVMRRILIYLSPAFFTCLLFAAQGADFEFPTQKLTVPDGFEIELIAGPPVVERPISGSFDEVGRLYVTDSSGSNDKVDKQLAERPHRIRRLEPAGSDGRFSKSLIFAEHMMFPEGCLWFDGSLYVSAPPSIWKLTDTDADGVADQRVEWHQGKTLTGCANDLHGPYLGLDGWIYWCKGAFASQTYERPGRQTISTRASHIFRAPQDHSDLEPVLTAGMDNPVGVVFSPEGERFMCGTFLMHPEAGKRDGVVHAVYGGVYGKDHDVLDDHKKTGDLMPIMTHLGAAAPCSVISYQSETFGAEYKNNLFVCCFNMHKITRHILEPDGATYKTRDIDFLVSNSTDFHPTDVIEDADGSLIVIDTGGWYKLCCPTSQLSKPDVLGAIYRIRRKGSPTVNDPHGLTLAWSGLGPDGLVKLLGDPRPAVRKRAIQEIARLGPVSVPALSAVLKKDDSVEARRNAVWALTRIDGTTARESVRAALTDRDESVRHAAIHSISLWRDPAAVASIISVLRDSRPQLQRVAAEALGRIGDKSVIPALLAASSKPCDRALEHSLTYALIELNDHAATLSGLKSASAHEKRVALVALDQMDAADPVRLVKVVTPMLASPDPLLRQTCLWIAEHHPQWGGDLAEFFKDRLLELSRSDAAPGAQEELRRDLVQFSTSAPIQELVGSSLMDPAAKTQERNLLMEVVANSGLREPPLDWTKGVRTSLDAGDEKLLGSAIAAARSLGQARTNAPDFSEALIRIAVNPGHNPAMRLQALAAMPEGLPRVDSDLFAFLCENVEPSKPVSMRADAAGVLAKAKLTDEQLITLATTLRDVGPLEMTKLLAPFAHSTNEIVGIRLMAELKESKSLSSLRPDLLQELATKYPGSVQEKSKELLGLLQVDTSRQRAHLEELLASLGKGDVRRGQAIFNSQKAACFSCHAMGYLGGHAGPDLTTIGQVRTERDLLESIIYPSASFVRSYEPYIVKTKSDEDYSGVLKKDAPDEVVLVTGPTAEVRLARADIVEMRPGTVSIMPAGLEQQLTKQELSDLVAFLKATKWGAN
jgi:putative membrane-bound dehydrogenase-like protein